MAVTTATPITLTTSLAGTTSIFVSDISVGINAYGLSIRYQAQDFTPSTSSSMSTSSVISTSSPIINSFSSSSSPTYSPAAAAASPALSGGIIAAVALGTIAVLTLFGGIIFALFFFIRRKKLCERGIIVPETSWRNVPPTSPGQYGNTVQEHSQHNVSPPNPSQHGTIEPENSWYEVTQTKPEQARKHRTVTGLPELQ